MKLPATVKFILCALWSVWAAGAGAVTISFDESPTRENNPVIAGYSANGFTFSAAHMHHMSMPGLCGHGCVDNGSQYLSKDATNSVQPNLIEMVAEGGLAFSLTGFDGAELKLVHLDSDAVVIDVFGELHGGGTVLASRRLDGIRDGADGMDDFQTFSLPLDFTDLVSVIFSGRNAGDGPGHFSIDNVVAELTPARRLLPPEPSRTVPEPGTLLLLGVALAALGIRPRAS